MTWYGLLARIDVVLHKIRHPKHRMIWRYKPDALCPGDIVCDTCDVIFWCRAQELTQKQIEEGLRNYDKH
jgi:hypothetical protein